MFAIACVSKNLGIGKDGKLLFHIPEDMEFFKRRTLNKVVVMGRSTYESIGHPLPNRINVVLSHTMEETDGVIIIRKPEELDRVLESLNKTSEDVGIIGGGELYKIFLPHCDCLFITEVDEMKDADTFFPDYKSTGEFKLADNTPLRTYQSMAYEIRTYRRVKDR